MNVSGYAAYLVKTYGPDICHQLDEKKWDTTKFTRSDLEAKIEEFRIRLNNLSNG
jgi:hypothetical protein